MSLFGKLFGRGGDDAHEPPSMPWDQRPSIFDHVQSHTDPDQPGLTQGGETLPDDDRVNKDSQIRWAAGALDGVMGHHMGHGDDDRLVHKAVDLILDYCTSPTATTKAALYRHIMEGNALPLIDAIIESLLARDRLNHERLYELAYSFVTEAPDREPVKFGIAILGLFPSAENEPLFQTLGRHEEFTLFCAVALSNIEGDPERSLWTLAKNVSGWGRIQVVERLAQTQDPEIKNWLLRDGYRNSVMYEYLAYTCATAGGLLAALSENTVDQELLTAAGEILSALIHGGPAEDIDDYEDGAVAVEMFLGHMESCAKTLEDFIAVHTIQQFVNEEEVDWDCRVARGWTVDRRRDLQDVCRRILNRPEWTERARRGLASDDDVEFHQASQVAEALGIDTWEAHWRRLQNDPTDSGRWYQVMVRCNNQRIADVIAFAERHIDLEAIATGPAAELGMGPDWQPHTCLDFVLQELNRFPGHGRACLSAGLKSPVVRNRNMAVNTLSAWDDDDWGDDLRKALEAAARSEPEEDVRERMERVLRGEPPDDPEQE